MSRARGHGRKCSFELANGSMCQAWALRASDPPLCRAHSMTPEERSSEGRRMAHLSGIRRRGDTEARPLADLRPDITLREVLDVVRPCLTATHVTGEPDISSRLAGCAVVLLAFPSYLRDSPEKCRELLARALPEELVPDPERVRAEATFASLRKEWFSLPAWHPIRGLVPRPLPREFVPPWQQYHLVVRAEAPREVPPEEAPVVHFPDGRVALKRGPNELPVMLKEVQV